MERHRTEAERIFEEVVWGHPPVASWVREIVVEKHMEFLSVGDAVLKGESEEDIFFKYDEYLTLRSNLLGFVSGV